MIERSPGEIPRAAGESLHVVQARRRIDGGACGGVADEQAASELRRKLITVERLEQEFAHPGPERGQRQSPRNNSRDLTKRGQLDVHPDHHSGAGP